jgi:hypothetical protein
MSDHQDPKSDHQDPKVEIETLTDDDLESASGGLDTIGRGFTSNSGTGTCTTNNTGTGTCS